MYTKILRKLLLSTTLGFAFANTHAQSPGGITTDPAVWYRPDNVTSALWKDASPSAIDLNVATNGALTINPGDAKHNFQPWTSGYSTVNYFRYDASTNSVFGALNDGGGTTTASTDYNGGYYYMPLTIFSAARPTSLSNGEITGIDNDINLGAEPGLGVKANGQNLNPRLYRFGNTIDQTATTINATIGQTSVFMSQPFGGDHNSANGNLILGLNGKDTSIANVSGRSSVSGPSMKIGYDGWTFGAFAGDIQEVVWYKAGLSTNDIQKVNTYLALKYGSTLAQNYVDAAGNTIYDLSANADYKNNIAGIGAESANGGLNQRQSNSINNGRQVIISTIGLANTNALNATSLNDGQYLVWGDNGLAKAPAIAESNIPGTNFRFASVWKTQNTGSVGTVRIAWPAQYSTIKLVQSNDPTFGLGNTVTDMTGNTQTVNGITYNYADVTLVDGAYFTFAVFAQTPGGVAIPAVWLRADAGIDTLAGRLDQWQNFGLSAGFAQQLQSGATTYTTPYYKQNIHNFNPSLVDSSTTADGGLELKDIFPNFVQRPLSTFVLQDQPDISQQRTMVSFINNDNFAASWDLPWFASQSASQLYFWWDGSYTAATTFPNGLKRYNNIPTINSYNKNVWSTNPDTTFMGMNGAGKMYAIGNSNSSLGIGQHLLINADGGNNNTSGGNISEVIVYDRKLTPLESLRVNSYMAIKYGITLYNLVGTNATDYLSSNEQVVWDTTTNAGYNNNIAGIAYDYNAGLNQKQSKSVNAGKQILISTTGLANTNSANNTSLTDGQYLVWGDNGLERMPSVAINNVTGTNFRFASVWKVQNTSSIGTVRVAWPQNSNLGALKLIESTDPAFATISAATDMTPNTQVINGVTYNYADVTLSDGQYFTFAAKVFAPGGIATLPAVWYQPNNASSKFWLDASVSELNLTNEVGSVTVNTGDQVHNFHKWTTDYSATNYYNYLDSNASNTDLETNPVFGNWNVSNYAYMPITIFGAARQTASGSGLITGIDNEKNTAAEPGLGTNGLHPRFYRYGNGIDQTPSTLTTTLGQTSLYYAHPNPGISGASAGNLVIGLDGYDTTIANQNGVSSVAGPYLKIGYEAFFYGAFKGDIQEVVWYKASLSQAEKLQVDTYLALKYGTTLSHNYVDAAGNTIFDISANDDYFSHNIAGIGKEENNGNLNQRQSNSVNAGKQLLISTTGLANTNEANSTSLSEGQYLVWGDNGLAKAPSIYTGSTFANQNVRFKAIWRVQNTGAVGAVRVAWPAGLTNLALITSTDTTFDANDVLTSMTGTKVVDGITYNYVDVNLNNGEYFTFAAKIDHAPGGVFTGLSQWYRADKQTTIVGGGDTTLTTWTDYASGVEASQVSTLATPKLHTGSNIYFNFNPGVNFTDGNQSLGNLTTQPITDTAYDIFTITKDGLAAGGSYARIYSVMADKTLTTGSPRYWDGIGINFDGNLERYNPENGVVYYANPGGISFATNSPSIMYHKYNYNSVSKGLNGAVTGAPGNSGPYKTVDGGFVFGSTVFASNGADNYSIIGNLGETIIYGSGNITTEERNRVDAYLAIKYGVTLNNAESYLTSASVKVWDKDLNIGFYNNVAGIGRDDLSDLYQKQSRSQITNNANDQLTIGIGDILATNNDNTGTLNNGQFLMWGDNGNTQAMTNVTSSYATLTFNSSDVRRMTRIWKAQGTNGATSVKVRFPVASVGTTNFPVDDAAQYVIIFASDSSITSNISVSQLTLNGSNYDVMHSFPAGASYFTFGKIQTAIVLPIDMAKDFAARSVGNTVVLDWTTASENNNKGFHVERSTDGQKWNNLAFINSNSLNGNSQKPLAYRFTDLSPLANTTNMYRLKQESLTGEVAFSRVVTILTGSNQTITLYPNPAHNILNITNLGAGVKKVRIVSVGGKDVYHVETASDKVAVNVQNWSKGIYWVAITKEDGHTVTFKAVVK